MSMKCGINGCKKLKIHPHTHIMGSASMAPDPNMVAAYRDWAAMRGEAFRMPGGDGSEANIFMAKRMKIGLKDAKKFRQQLAREREELKKKKK